MESGQQQPQELAEALKAISVDAAFPPNEYEVELGGPTDAFNAQSANAVRPQHAINAVQDPTDVSVYGYQEARFFVASKLVSIPAGDFVLLAVGTERDQKRFIESAYRLYGEASEMQRLAVNATEAFQTFLERFAIPYETRGREVLFVPVLTGKIPAGTQPDLDAILGVMGIKWRPGERPAKAFNLNAAIKFTPAGEITMTWPFLLDNAAYKQALAQR